MKPYTPACQKCGGTIGPLEHIEQHIIAPSHGNTTTKFTEVWFHCIQCEFDLEPSNTLITIII